MEYLPTLSDPKKLSALIWKHFKNVPRPATHFSSVLPLYVDEFTASENLDLETATIQQIQSIYESNTFYSGKGFKYRFPRMFDLQVRLGQAAAGLDFCSTFFSINTCCDHPKRFTGYTDCQKFCVWLSIDYLDLHFDGLNLYDHDANRINKANNTALEVVLLDGIKTLSVNLFQDEEPPMDLIRKFSQS